MELQTSGDVERRLLELLPANGESRTNADLRKQLDVDEDTYWAARDGLVEIGRVVKRPGRGGKTALAILDADDDNESSGGFLAWLPGSVFLIAVLLLLGALVYAVVSYDVPSWGWNFLSLILGAVTIAAVGVSLLIYRLQESTGRSHASDQARVLRRIEKLATQTASSSSDTRDFLSQMHSAQQAAQETPNPTPDQAEAMQTESVFGSVEPQEDVVTRDHGKFYRPSAVPLRLVADMVRWWEESGEDGRWTIANLIGGYRKFNASGGLQGVPWILSFRSGDGEEQNYQVSYSGRRKGATVSVYDETLGWREPKVLE